MAWPSSKNKYGATRVSHAGYSFHSKLEASVFDYLSLLQKAGDIENLTCQAHVHLSLAKILYIVDFKAFDLKKEEVVYYEAKGLETSDWKLKKRLWEYYGPGDLQIFKGSAARPVHTETVKVKVIK